MPQHQDRDVFYSKEQTVSKCSVTLAVIDSPLLAIASFSIIEHLVWSCLSRSSRKNHFQTIPDFSFSFGVSEIFALMVGSLAKDSPGEGNNLHHCVKHRGHVCLCLFVWNFCKYILCLDFFCLDLWCTVEESTDLEPFLAIHLK